MPIIEKIEYLDQESKSLNQVKIPVEFGFSEKSEVYIEANSTRKLFHEEKRINPKQISCNKSVSRFVETEHHSSGYYIDTNESSFYLCSGCRIQLAPFKEYKRVVDAYRIRGIGKPWTAEIILQVDGPLGHFENLVNVDVDMHEYTPNRNIYCEKCSNELGFQNNAIDTEGQHYIFMNKLLLQRQ